MIDRLAHERELTASLLRLARIYRRETDRLLATLGMSDAKVLPVMHIARLGEGVRQGVLADVIGVEGPSLVRILDQLCVAGLVERREDAEDRRARTLHLTDDGRRLAAKAEALLDDLRARFLVGVEDPDLAAAVKALAQFQHALEGPPDRRPDADL